MKIRRTVNVNGSKLALRVRHRTSIFGNNRRRVLQFGVLEDGFESGQEAAALPESTEDREKVDKELKGNLIPFLVPRHPAHALDIRSKR